METIQIRLPKAQIQLIDKEVRGGIYRSRSEAVRDMLERIRFLIAFDELGELLRKEGVTKKELLQKAEKMRGQIYKKYL